MRVLIVDDEAPARRRLAMMLGQMAGVTVAGAAANGDEALEMVATLRPDVVLLDIEMPGRDGVEVASVLAGGDPPVMIFVTAFDHYAVQAFEHAALDYLLKPVAFERMQAAIGRAAERLRTRGAEDRIAEMAEVIAALRKTREREAPTRPAYMRELWVQRRSEKVRVEVSRINVIEAERDYVRLHTRDNAYLLREKIGQLEAVLDPEVFLRVHRSTIVRRSWIGSIRQIRFGAFAVVSADGEERRVGHKYVGGVRALMDADPAPVPMSPSGS